MNGEYREFRMVATCNVSRVEVAKRNIAALANVVEARRPCQNFSGP